MPDVRVVCRDATPEDEPFVLDSWTRSYQLHGPDTRWIRKSVFHRQHADLIRQLLRGDRLTIAHPPGLEDEIAGWICWRPGDPRTLHYGYTKAIYRKHHVCRQLLESTGWILGDPLLATHITHAYTDWTVRHRYRVEYNPYLRGPRCITVSNP